MSIAHHIAETGRSIKLLSNMEQAQLFEQEDGTWHFHPRGPHRDGILLIDEAHKQRVTDQVMAWGVVGLAIVLSFFVWRTWLHLFALTALGAGVGFTGAFRAYAGEVRVPPVMSRKAFRLAGRSRQVRNMSYARIVFMAIGSLVMGGASFLMALDSAPGSQEKFVGYMGTLFIFMCPIFVWLFLLKRKVAAMDMADLLKEEATDESAIS